MHDPILERALSQVRTERVRHRRRRGGVVTVVGAALAAAALAGGAHLGRHSVPGERVLVAGTADGVRLTATITPADGWVRLHAVVDGVEAGERCHLVVTDVRGRRHVAGGWVAARPSGPGPGDTALAGAALVDPDELASVDVVTVDGRVLVTGSAG
ncbi:hypothetical protein B0I31_110210 [Saccharothrix carnea]|uniref:Anti-sigma-K factor rskA n=1 Tax=Saccharothrix carnea TaxID=1280637 RepID=A0A2P8I3S7_SACCR|nr:hypothetical protein [Saccharothrix carnea]PSL53117.1 hypothetical protein B0I31_110210 [Saccharothrix carnea]